MRDEMERCQKLFKIYWYVHVVLFTNTNIYKAECLYLQKTLAANKKED